MSPTWQVSSYMVELGTAVKKKKANIRKTHLEKRYNRKEMLWFSE